MNNKDSLCTVFHVAGYTYAGVQNGTHCYCGNEYGIHRKVSHQSCDEPCEGDSTTVCGGPLLNSMFSTGLDNYCKQRQYQKKSKVNVVTLSMSTTSSQCNFPEIPLAEYSWEFQYNTLWDTLLHALFFFYLAYLFNCSHVTVVECQGNSWNAVIIHGRYQINIMIMIGHSRLVLSLIAI